MKFQRGEYMKIPKTQKNENPKKQKMMASFLKFFFFSKI